MEVGPGRRIRRRDIAVRPGFNLDIWADVGDESLEDTASLPEPAVIAEEIVANLTTALEQFAAVAAELNGDGGGVARD
jgi:type I restriction enzyme M protein